MLCALGQHPPRVWADMKDTQVFCHALRKPSPPGEAMCSSCRPSWHPTSLSSISQDASKWFQSSSLCILPTEALDITEHRQANPTVPCPNSWPKEIIRIIKLLFYITKFWGSLSHSNNNWYTSSFNLAGLLRPWL